MHQRLSKFNPFLKSIREVPDKLLSHLLYLQKLNDFLNLFSVGTLLPRAALAVKKKAPARTEDFKK